MNENVNSLLNLANYFRSAMMDELKLPENAATMPTLVQVNDFQMIKVSSKTKHYQEVVNEIEKALEVYALQLTASMPQQLIQQKKIDFNADIKKKATDKKPVVTAQTDINKEETKIIDDYLITKESDKSQPIYGSLLAMPEGKLKAEDREFIVNGWNTLKGMENKAKIYNKVRELLNNYEIPVRVLREDITKFIAKHKSLTKDENLNAFDKEIQEAGISFNTDTDMSKIRSGEVLTSGKLKWLKDDGEFNIALLTDAEDEDHGNPQNYLKLWAMYYRVIGNERQAIDIITKFYSDSKKGTIWSTEKARYFLNKLFRENEFKELRQVLKNMFIYRNSKGDYEAAVPFAKSLLFNYSKRKITVKKEGKEVEIEKSWPAHKVDNFINGVIAELAREGKIILKSEAKSSTAKKAEPVKKSEFSVKFWKTANNKVSGKVFTDKKAVSVTNYDSLKAFKKACELIALNTVRVEDPKATKENITIKYEETAVGTASPKTGKNTPKNKVVVPPYKAGDNTAKKDKKGKVINIVQNKPNKAVKKDQVTNTTQNQKEALKSPKKGQLEHPTKSNVSEKKMPNAKPADKPSYSAIISLEKDKTYTCVINGFNEVIKVTGAKSVEEAKKSFVEALQKYNEKVIAENEKAKASHKKGKMLHLKPDFTKGELTFLLKTVKTGTNG